MIRLSSYYKSIYIEYLHISLARLLTIPDWGYGWFSHGWPSKDHIIDLEEVYDILCSQKE